ncbi:MAG: methyl-accepting chemotaxis protein [Clostridium sp.]
MFNKKSINQLVNDISLLEQPKLNKKIDNSTLEKIKSIHLRINTGKTNFEEITELVMNSVMQMSSLDLLLKDKEEKINAVTCEIVELMEDISQASESTTHTAVEVTTAHGDLTEAISELSSNSSLLLASSEKSRSELDEVKKFSETAIDHSRGMKEDMSNLINVIENIQGVINSINDISEQTNLLALNASIEAARAGESGRGFAVVAEEIRKLADETKTLTSGMGHFVSAIENASNKSCLSVDNTVEALNVVNKNLDSIISTSKENRESIDTITESISVVAANSEEINASMDDVAVSVKGLDRDVEKLSKNTGVLRDISEGLNKVILPVTAMEEDLDKAVTIIGELVKDRYYMVNNEFFIRTIKKAILAHEKWLETLKTIVSSKTIMPLQVDEHKCGFGHFYYSMNPQNKDVISIWSNLEDKHKKFHGLGKSIIKHIRTKDYGLANSAFEKAEILSAELISDFEKIVEIVEKLEIENKNVYEN